MNPLLYTVWEPKDDKLCAWLLINETNLVYYWDVCPRYNVIDRQGSVYSLHTPKEQQKYTTFKLEGKWIKTKFTFDDIDSFKKWFTERYFEHLI
jgi:hypothetical protein